MDEMKKPKRKMKTRYKLLIIFGSIFLVLLILVLCLWTKIMYFAGILNRTSADDYKTYYSEVRDDFKELTYNDTESGLSITYGLYVPKNYDENKKYPMITFIGDSGAVGTSLEKSFKVGIGGLVFASSEEQEKHESFVLIPQYPEVIVDDHSGFTETAYVDLTKRLIENVESNYSVDTDRVYGTGQSMGCMTTIVLASRYKDLYTACLFIDGQWDITTLKGLEEEKFIYVAAAGDAKASAGQQEVKDMFSSDGIAINEIKDIDAKNYDDTKIRDFLNNGSNYNFITFATGTTLPSYVSSGTDEHMFSFDWGYRLVAARDWLYSQTKD